MALSAFRYHHRGAPLAALAAILVASLLAPVAAAATPTVGAPTASAKFLSGISLKGAATLTGDVVRVELVLDFEGSTRSEIADVPTTVKTGPATLAYTLETPSGGVLPNTDITARFRLTLTDGSTIVGPATTVHYEDTRYAWKTVSGEFVRVHYTEGGSAFGQRAVKIADDAIREVSSLLGVTEDDPVDFFIYADRTAFYDVLGPATRENVGGEALPNIRTLFANIAPSAVDDPWVGIVIPHELTHLVFDTAVHNDYHYPPRWLNEGIAVYLSEGYGGSDRNAVAQAVDDGSVMPLRALTAQFPTTAERFSLAYSESVSAVSFMVDKYGRNGMVSLVRAYAGGVSDDEAFQAGLGTDVAGFEAAWLASLGVPTPSPFGPLPAPAGPLPSGWGGAAPTAGTAPGDSATGAPVASPTAAPSPGAVDDGDGNVGAVAAVVLLLAIAAVVVGWMRRRPRPGVALVEGPEPVATTPVWSSPFQRPAGQGPGGPPDAPTVAKHPAHPADPGEPSAVAPSAAAPPWPDAAPPGDATPPAETAAPETAPRAAPDEEPRA